MQQCGVYIMDVHFVALGVEAIVVGGAMRESAFHPAAGHPHCEAPRVMVTAVHARSLHGGRATEFAAPKH